MTSQYRIQNVAVVDVAKGSILPNRSVVVVNERITDVVGYGTHTPSRDLDAGGLYLCPGLIDCHVHFFLDAGSSPGRTYIERDDDARLEVARRNAKVAIEAGITTMRDCGAPAPLMFEFRREVERGYSPGPHILCCGHPLMRPKGHCHFLGGEVATKEDVRRMIEAQLEQGADFVKLMASGGGLTPGTNPYEADLSLELMRTAVEVAHAHDVQVTAHCHARQSIERALETGLDMIEHVSFVGPEGYRYDEKLAKRLRGRGMIMSPTVSGALRTAKRFRESGKPHNPNDFAAVERLEGRLANTRHFHRLGMRIIGGTDCGGGADTPFDSLVDELLAYANAGLSNADALRTVTSDSAAFMKLPTLGEVKPGYRADLILLSSDPLEDLSALRKPVMVFKSGRLVHDRREGIR
ncbi:MAG: amidohydrolase family protein [Elusimicrobia bacterium]|nr:amidohydrolase family protein [Elusimicrobiota bacterium]